MMWANTSVALVSTIDVKKIECFLMPYKIVRIRANNFLRYGKSVSSPYGWPDRDGRSNYHLPQIILASNDDKYLILISIPNFTQIFVSSSKIPKFGTFPKFHSPRKHSRFLRGGSPWHESGPEVRAVIRVRRAGDPGSGNVGEPGELHDQGDQ